MSSQPCTSAGYKSLRSLRDPEYSTKTGGSPSKKDPDVTGLMVKCIQHKQPSCRRAMTPRDLDRALLPPLEFAFWTGIGHGNPYGQLREQGHAVSGGSSLRSSGPAIES